MEEGTENLDVSQDDRCARLLGLVALLAVLLHPTQVSFDILGIVNSSHLNLSLADLAIGAAFLIWAVRRIRQKDPTPPPGAAIAVLGFAWLGLSLIPQLKWGRGALIVTARSGAVEVAQFGEYFIAAYIVFAEVFHDECRRRRLIMALLAVTLLAVIFGWVQYLSTETRAVDVRGTGFGNRNTFGMFLALALPLLFGAFLFGRSRWGCVGIAILSVAGLCVCLAGGAFLAACLGLLVVASLRGRGAFAISAIALVALAALVLPHLPRRNSAVLLDSVALYRTNDPYDVFQGDVQGIHDRLMAKQGALAHKIGTGEPISHADLINEQDTSWKWQQRYMEWQASLNMMRRSPLFGVGAGCYQRNVNRFYDMPKYPLNLLEPDTLSGYMIWGASAGIPFLVIVFCMFLSAAWAASRAFYLRHDSAGRGLAAGILGSLASLAVVGVFSNPFVRGVGVTVALILALAQVVRMDAAPATEGSS